ncbi:MAG TPA: hypothetical protein VKV80_19950 [Streptosporangiaceae bacterium]|nr:hypothetical protein [Streptosporangiaceae bacterium]
MSVTPEENIRQWLQVEARARLGAAAAAEAMARYIAERTARDTLQRNRHAPGAYHKAAPGAPPASASGSLARGMYSTPASGGLRASAYAGNRAEHARLLEFGGCVLTPKSGKVMHWTDSAGSWYHRRLPARGEYPEHPFLGPTTDEAIGDGELRRVAADAFREYDP